MQGMRLIRGTLLGTLLVAAACARAPAPLEMPATTRLVVVAPHPDDETLGAGGGGPESP